MSNAFFLNDVGVACAMGDSPHEVALRIFSAQSGITTMDSFSPGRLLPLGAVNAELPSLGHLPVNMHSRNNQLAMLAARQLCSTVAAAVERYGQDRVAVVVGTSTSGIGESQAAVRAHVETGRFPEGYRFAQQELGSLSGFLADVFELSGPAFVHSSACASGAKAMASAARLLQCGAADAVVTGGVDSLSAFTVAGFAALNLVSTQRCNPFSINRNGINIGEAAVLFVMTREPATVRLMGWGESSDGHHFSAPDPAGCGAKIAIEAALARSGIAPRAVEYVNLHATGSRANDEMEGAVIHAMFGQQVPTSGTKQLTGHALGAAGALEAAICWMTMQDTNTDGRLPPHLWDGERDPDIAPLHLVAVNEQLGRQPRVALSTSFAFGGANAALVFGRE